MTLLSRVARTTAITAIAKTEPGKACGRITCLVSAFVISAIRYASMLYSGIAEGVWWQTMKGLGFFTATSTITT
jgi:hypothetical protein